MSDNENKSRRDLRIPNNDEVFAVVTNMLGANRIRVHRIGDVERTTHVPGRMQKRVWVQEDNVVLIEPWSWQDGRTDVSWRYKKPEADQLRRGGHVQ